MNVAEGVVERLVHEGVEVIFTLPGEQHDLIFAALARTSIRVVHVRHEQAAALMAYGYARSSGRLGVFLVLSGPGVLNALTGLATAYAGDARVLCLAAQIPTALLGRSLGVPHEIPDQLGMLRRVTGWSARVAGPTELAGALDEAFVRLRSGRPRPVALEIPVDVLAAHVETITAGSAPARCAPPDPESVEVAAAALSRAARPVMFVGSGARGASRSVTELAERLQVPVTTELGGRGVLRDDHHLAISLPVAHRLWPDVDLLLAVGTRLLRPTVEWGISDLPIIRVDLDEQEINRVEAPAMPVVGDAEAVLEALLERLEPVQEREDWLAAVAGARAEIAAELAVLSPQLDYLAALRRVLPEDGFFVDEMTQIGYVARLAFPVLQPSTYVLPTYVGALGFGFATALGVKIAQPDRAVLSISGDGGFLYTATELATAVQHGIAVVAVVFTDGSFGNVRRSQRRLLGSTVATELHNPDFVAFAASFGAIGVRAADPDQLADQVQAAFSRDRLPTVIEVPVGDLPDPWPFIRLPRVR